MITKFLKKHSFGLMTSAAMSAIMMSVNVFANTGFTLDAFRTLGIYYLPIFAIAFIISTYIVMPIVIPIMKRLTNKNTKPFAKVLLMTLLMVSFMATLMSLTVTAINVPFNADFISTWLSQLARNYPIAFFVQLLIVGPAVRFTHASLFPKPETQAAPSQAN